jgi:hypothetical protein
MCMYETPPRHSRGGCVVSSTLAVTPPEFSMLPGGRLACLACIDMQHATTTTPHTSVTIPHHVYTVAAGSTVIPSWRFLHPVSALPVQSLRRPLPFMLLPLYRGQHSSTAAQQHSSTAAISCVVGTHGKCGASVSLGSVPRQHIVFFFPLLGQKEILVSCSICFAYPLRGARLWLGARSGMPIGWVATAASCRLTHWEV